MFSALQIHLLKFLEMPYNVNGSLKEVSYHALCENFVVISGQSTSPGCPGSRKKACTVFHITMRMEDLGGILVRSSSRMVIYMKLDIGLDFQRCFVEKI